MKRTVVLAAVAGLAIPVAARAAEILVPDQFGTIQAAINAANTDDEILVAPGTYSELIDLDGKQITVRSTGGALVTTINGGASGTVITCDDFEGPGTVIDGFTLTNGIGTDQGGVRRGGGVVNDMSDPTYRNCIIEGNAARDGAGMYNRIADPTIINCVFFDNDCTSFGKGGAVYNSTSNPVLKNCTIVDNSATDGGAFYNDTSVPRLISCIVWDNAPEPFFSTGAIQTIATYSDIDVPGPSPYDGEGNILADPFFVDQAGGDLSLTSVSPCIDRGDSTAIAAESFTDVAGDARGVDVPTVPDRGIAVFGLTVDIGAYEFQSGGDCTSDCPGDIDGSGDIGLTDLLTVLGFWGPCS